jgi:asparagine synthase (glutamine-hydrolysing)
MCGIAGYIGGDPPDDGRLETCLGLMGRRGPDASGTYRHDPYPGWSVRLLHSRLSIIDLAERATQPIGHQGKWLITNGEIYNYLEVKAALEQRGEVNFTTKGDSEVLLRVLCRDGVEGLDQVEGMFAFGFYDEASATLTLGRDRFGEKPLYLFEEDGGVYFGSEVKFIRALRGQRMEINERQICRFIVNGYRSLNKSSETFWHGVRELPSGNVLEISQTGRTGPKSYWQFGDLERSDMSFIEAVAGAREAIIEAVRLRLRSDVPLAFCMSGGVDSNGLISIAHNKFGFDVHGFTIVNEHERYAEQDMVDLAVSTQGLRHTPVHLTTKDFLPRLTRLVAYHDAPVYTISAYTHWLLMEAVAEHGYKTVISGTGADELFSGYYDHHLFYLADMSNSAAEHHVARENWKTHIKELTNNPLLKNPDLFINDPETREHLYMNARGFAGYFHHPFYEDFSEHRYVPGHLRNRMLNELFVETIPPPLHEEDLNAMYWSLENRSPYLDRRLMEFCMTIPTRHLIQHGRAKAVLREALRGIVPDAIVDNRRKMGFNAPLLDLLDLGDAQVRETLLDGSGIFEIVDRTAIEKLLLQPDLSHENNLFLFYVLSSKLFLDQHC